jgi:hypothetical protein
MGLKSDDITDKPTITNQVSLISSSHKKWAGVFLTDLLAT